MKHDTDPDISSGAPTLSPQNRKVLDVLVDATKSTRRAMSAYDILDRLKRAGIKSPPTVYRALDKLAGLGLIHRLESLNAYVACCQHGHDHHDGHDHKHDHGHDHISQFAICTQCGDVQELQNAALAKALKTTGEAFLDHVDKRTVELSGICRTCAQA